MYSHLNAHIHCFDLELYSRKSAPSHFPVFTVVFSIRIQQNIKLIELLIS